MVLPGERQLVLKLGHMILDHTHQGMRIYPSALIAATILQSIGGIPLGEGEMVANPVSGIRELMFSYTPFR